MVTSKRSIGTASRSTDSRRWGEIRLGRRPRAASSPSTGQNGEMSRRSNLCQSEARPSRSSGQGWQATQAALSAPTDVPTRKSGRAPSSANARSIPTWTAPRLPPTGEQECCRHWLTLRSCSVVVTAVCGSPPTPVAEEEVRPPLPNAHEIGLLRAVGQALEAGDQARRSAPSRPANTGETVRNRSSSTNSGVQLTFCRDHRAVHKRPNRRIFARPATP
jgi:hypothetical protein